MMTITMIVISLMILHLVHFLADFPLQNSYMLGKFKDKGWILPLLSHCAVHILLNFLAFVFIGILSGYTLIPVLSISFLVSILNGAIHFVVDRIKASPNLGGRWQHPQREYYIALGADQLAHHWTMILSLALFIFLI